MSVPNKTSGPMHVTVHLGTTLIAEKTFPSWNDELNAFAKPYLAPQKGQWPTIGFEKIGW